MWGETEIEEISIEAGSRVVKYQDRIKKETENVILKKYRSEVNRRE